VVFSLLSYLILISLEYAARFLHSPSLLDRGHWENSRDPEAEIHNGQEERLLFGKLRSEWASRSMDTGVLLSCGEVTTGNSPTVYLRDTSPSTLIVQLTLSAKPEIRGGPVIRKYSLTPEGLSEIP
jgi:hypothetical protein